MTQHSLGWKTPALVSFTGALFIKRGFNFSDAVTAAEGFSMPITGVQPREGYFNALYGMRGKQVGLKLAHASEVPRGYSLATVEGFFQFKHPILARFMDVKDVESGIVDFIALHRTTQDLSAEMLLFLGHFMEEHGYDMRVLAGLGDWKNISALVTHFPQFVPDLIDHFGVGGISYLANVFPDGPAVQMITVDMAKAPIVELKVRCEGSLYGII
jgi:hypothetical protein